MHRAIRVMQALTIVGVAYTVTVLAWRYREASANSTPPLAVPAVELFDAYLSPTANSIAADERYRDHPLLVTGEIFLLSRTKTGEPVLVFGPADREVYAVFDDARGLAALHVGQEVTVLCLDGTRLRNERDVFVTIRDCTLR